MGKKDTRNNFRQTVFERDEHTCKVCGVKRPEAELDAHHITDRNEMPGGGYVAENGITVCKDECHMKVEYFHISDNKQWNPGLHPDDLYRMIDSSYELAFEKSEELK
jgi:5-methylcytosine-specific restriction endonuclease McrA